MSEQRKCQRPGCEGSYEDMGGGELYCGVCGLAPVVSVSATGLVGSPPTGLTRADRGSSSARSGTGSSSHVSARSSLPVLDLPPVGVRAAVTLAVRPELRSPSVSVRSSGASAGLRPAAGSARVWSPCRTCRGPDPAATVMTDPEVPERKRFCSRSDCGAQVGRSAGASGRAGQKDSAPNAATRTPSYRS